MIKWRAPSAIFPYRRGAPTDAPDGAFFPGPVPGVADGGSHGYGLLTEQ
jgi:hypothetical protein